MFIFQIHYFLKDRISGRGEKRQKKSPIARIPAIYHLLFVYLIVASVGKNFRISLSTRICRSESCLFF